MSRKILNVYLNDLPTRGFLRTIPNDSENLSALPFVLSEIPLILSGQFLGYLIFPFFRDTKVSCAFTQAVFDQITSNLVQRCLITMLTSRYQFWEVLGSVWDTYISVKKINRFFISPQWVDSIINNDNFSHGNIFIWHILTPQWSFGCLPTPFGQL